MDSLRPRGSEESSVALRSNSRLRWPLAGDLLVRYLDSGRSGRTDREGGTVKANRIHRFGSPDVVVFEECERPVPRHGEVLVRVEASGVGPWDALVRTGRSATAQPLPLTLGSDLAGVVEEVGEGVSTLHAGDEVFGVTNEHFTGANAQHAIASAAMLARKPAAIGHVEAASVPVVAVTAWQMLFAYARLDPGQTVLVHGAGGNVGGFAVQLARLRGLKVVATARSGEVEAVRELGASRVIDVSRVPFEQESGSVDAVLDTVGGEVQQRSLSVLKPGGALVSIVSRPDAEEARRRGVTARFFLVEVTTEALIEIADLIVKHQVKVRVGTVLPLQECRRAHEMLDGLLPRAPGKIVLATREA